MTLQVGDEVRVYGYGRSRNRTASGEPLGEPGTVTRVGRTLIDVQVNGYGQTLTFRLDTQQWNDPNYSHRHHFQTLEQVALAERRATAVAVLHTYGIRVDGRDFKPSVEQLEELAAVVQTWPWEGER